MNNPTETLLNISCLVIIALSFTVVSERAKYLDTLNDYEQQIEILQDQITDNIK